MKTALRDVKEMAALHGSIIQEAYDLAAQVHKDEKRGSGEPYITHPVAVAKVLFDVGVDADVICAALLHDALESHHDFDAMSDRIFAGFGDHILYLVDAISKDERIPDKEEQQSEYMKQIIRSFEVDIFVFMIKISDLIHNLSTISGLPEKRKNKWLQELHTQYFPVFSGLFHRVPLGQRDTFLALMDRLESEIEKFEALHNGARKV